MWRSRCVVVGLLCDCRQVGAHYIDSQPGEMTDKGHETTLALGQRLRRLYVDQLDFMPKMIQDANMIYLRASAIPRALVSLQQCFVGMYPASARTASFSPPAIITRTAADETLYPNPLNCLRLNQLNKAFAQRTADRCRFLLKEITWAPDYKPTKFNQGTRLKRWIMSILSSLNGCLRKVNV